MTLPENPDLDQPTANRSLGIIWRGLAVQLLTIVILPLSVLLIITAFAGLALHQQSMRDLTAERDERTVLATANTLGELIQQRQASVQGLASRVKSDASSQNLSADLSETSKQLGDRQTSLACFDYGGNLLSSTGEAAYWTGADINALIALAEQTGPGEPLYRLLSTSQAAEPAFVTLVISQDHSAICGGVFSISELIQRALDGVFPVGGESTIFVISPDGQTLFRQGEGATEMPLVQHPGVKQALQGHSGSTYFKVGNDEHIVAYSPVQPVGWALVVEEPWGTIASRMLRLTENAPLVLIPIVVLAALALWFSSRYIVRPLQALESRSVSLGRGDFEAIEEPVGGIEEIRNLQAELVLLARKVRASQQGLRNYIGAITQGQEDERRRLARELHDDTLQSLIALNQRLQLLQLGVHDAPHSQGQAQAVQQIQAMTEQIIQDLRRVTRALRPVYLEELGLVAALKMLARETGGSQGLFVEFQRIGREQRLVPEVELALYRIAQEALTNVVKHAEASHANLRIAFTPELVTMEVWDNGKGYEVPESPSTFAPGGHYGLLGLFERAEMIGARLEVISSPGKGTRVTVILPM